MFFSASVKKIIVFGLGLFFLPGILRGQEKEDDSYKLGEGLPYFENFTTAEHGGGQQSWDMVQDKEGVLYIANSYGVLMYDGSQWKLIDINGSFHIFQLAYHEETGRIYVGGSAEIGYIEAGTDGRMRYHSLLSEIDPKQQSFVKINFCFIWNGKVWFTTPNKIFIWTGQQMNIIFAQSLNMKKSSEVESEETTFGNYFTRNKKLYIEHSQKGLLRWTGTGFDPVQRAGVFREIGPTRFLHPYQNNKILAGTYSNELYLIDSSLTEATRFRTQADQFLKRNLLYTATLLHDGSIALGTTKGGLAIVDSTGQWRQLINKNADLIDNNIHFVFQEKKGAIWLTMNVGLTRIEWPPVISIFDDRLDDFGDALSMTRYKGNMYIGAYSGLYSRQNSAISVLRGDSPPDRTAFEKTGLPASGIWDLHPTTNGLLVGSEEGIFSFHPELKKKRKILSGVVRELQHAQRPGSTVEDMQTVHALLSDRYTPLRFNSRDRNWQPAAPYRFNENGFFIVQDTNALWIATLWPSVFRLEGRYTDTASAHFSRYDSTSGLPAQGPYTAGLFEDELMVGTSKGAYRFQESKNRFVPDQDFNELMGGPWNFEDLTTDGEGNVWLEVYDGEDNFILRLHKNDDGSYTRQKKPFNRAAQIEPGLFYEDPVDRDITWISDAKNLLRYSDKLHAQKEYGAGFTLIREVRSIKNDSLLLANISDTLEFEFSPQRNDLRFNFALPANDAPEETTFRYYLEGFDKTWSIWTRESQKDYTNLPPGSYTFHVQGKNVYQQTGKTASFTFRIATPWYFSTLAWIIYIVATLLGLGWIIHSYGRYRARRQQYIEQVKTDEREKVRQKMAADFHDDMGNRITRISLLTKLLQQNNKGRAKEFLRKIENNASALYSETREFIWQMDPEKDTLFNTFAWLKEFGEELFEDVSIEFRTLSIPSRAEEIQLDMKPRGHMIRIFKEAMHNTLKHSEAQICTLKIELNEREAAIIFSDNGRGWNNSGQQNAGNGLNNMRQRAEQAGGSLEIESEPKNGTSIRYTFGIDD